MTAHWIPIFRTVLIHVGHGNRVNNDITGILKEEEEEKGFSNNKMNVETILKRIK